MAEAALTLEIHCLVKQERTVRILFSLSPCNFFRYKFNDKSSQKSTKARVYRYKVLQRISLPRIYNYKILSKVSLSRIYRYRLLSRLSRTYRYRLLNRLSLSHIYRYRILNRVSLSRVYRYKLLQQPSLSCIYRYRISTRISLSRIYRYKIVAMWRVSLPLTYRYKIISRTSLSQVYRYRYSVLFGPSSSLIGKQITNWTVGLFKSGTPSGNVTATIYDGTNAVVATFNEIIKSTILPTSSKAYRFNLSTPRTISANDRLVILYGGAATINISIYNTDQFDGADTLRTRWNGTIWVNGTTEEITVTLHTLE